MRTKDLALIGVYTAILIGAQVALTAVSGVEIVTILLLSFSFAFGVKRSLILVNLFSILRCIVFGFFPSVMILYLFFYNVFALVVGYIGKRFNFKASKKSFVIIFITAFLLTILFTLLDDIITPLFYAYTVEATRLYFITSLTALIPQLICTSVTVCLLFIPLNKLLLNLKS